MTDIAQAKNDDPRKCTCHPADDPPNPCMKLYALSECRTAALVEAMAQLLDDMGKTGQSVCMAAKAQARVAYEPFIDEQDWADDCLMPLHEAKRILAECDR